MSTCSTAAAPMVLISGMLLSSAWMSAASGQPAGDKKGNAADVDPRPKVFLLFDFGDDLKDEKIQDVMRKMPNRNMNFGLAAIGNKLSKRLLFGPRGHTNNTWLRIGGADFTFGKKATGVWEGNGPKLVSWEKPAKLPSWVHKEGVATWIVKGIHVTQQVRIIPGEPVEVEPGVFKRYYDTCEVVYRIVNRSGQPQDVGMRILLDTLIGSNDGVPFVVPTYAKALHKGSFKPAPAFITAAENADLKDPGIIVQLNMRHALADRKLEPPDELRITKWPGDPANLSKSLEKWDIPVVDPRQRGADPDSAVVMYWNPKPLANGKTRDLGYTYRLLHVQPDTGPGLDVAVGGALRVGGEIAVTAVMTNPKKGETVKLEIPEGLKLVSGKLEQAVPESIKREDGTTEKSVVTWLLEATTAGKFTIRVLSTMEKLSRERQVVIRQIVE